MKLRTLLAAALGVIPVALFALMAVTLGATSPLSSGPPAPLAVLIVATMLGFQATGVLLATRRPENPIGWLFLVMGLGFTMGIVSEEYAVGALVLQPELPAGIWAAWVSQWFFVLWLYPLPLVLLLFPDGRLPSPRWRPVVTLIVIGSVVQALASALRPGPFGSELLAAYSNPLGVEAMAGLADLVGGGPYVGIAYLLCGLAAIARFRRARGLERQQLKLFAYSAGLIATILVALLLVQPAAYLLGVDARGLDDLLWYLFIVSFGAVVIAVAAAILRYRLYDIDLLINRTVVYGATSLTIAITFFLGIVALQAALRPLTQGGELAVAASTLVSFALFQPIRLRVQDAVNRRFDRSRYDAARMLDDFADRLRDEVDLDSVHAELIAAVGTTMAPAHASLWLRERTR